MSITPARRKMKYLPQNHQLKDFNFELIENRTGKYSSTAKQKQVINQLYYTLLFLSGLRQFRLQLFQYMDIKRAISFSISASLAM